jgi:hypothetical protein
MKNTGTLAGHIRYLKYVPAALLKGASGGAGAAKTVRLNKTIHIVIRCSSAGRER